MEVFCISVFPLFKLQTVLPFVYEDFKLNCLKLANFELKITSCVQLIVLSDKKYKYCI